MENVVLGHAIREQSKNVAYLNLLNNFNVGFTLMATYLLSVFPIFVVAFLLNELNELTRRIRCGARSVSISKRILLTLSKFHVRLSRQPISALSLFFLFVHLFIWFSEHFLTNHISTNSVVRTRFEIQQHSNISNISTSDSEDVNIQEDSNRTKCSSLFRWWTRVNWLRTNMIYSPQGKWPACRILTSCQI